MSDTPKPIVNAITTAGATLIARTISEGKPFVFTGAKLGTGIAAAGTDLSSMTALITYYADAEITNKHTDEAGHLVITVSFWNDNVSEFVEIGEIGLYAKLEGDASPVLFSYLTFGDYADRILPHSASDVQRTCASVSDRSPKALTSKKTLAAHRHTWIQAARGPCRSLGNEII